MIKNGVKRENIKVCITNRMKKRKLNLVGRSSDVDTSMYQREGKKLQMEFEIYIVIDTIKP